MTAPAPSAARLALPVGVLALAALAGVWLADHGSPPAPGRAAGLADATPAPPRLAARGTTAAKAPKAAPAATAAVRGRVTSALDGRAVAGVDVFVATGRTLPRRAATTDAEGRYQVGDLEPGEVAVYARGNGWVTRGLDDVQTTGWNPFCVTVLPGSSAVADRVVVAGARAVGHVLDAEGKPVAGATVSADPVAPYGEGVGPVGSLLGGATAGSAADGSFALEGLVPGVAYAFGVRAFGLPARLAGTRVARSGDPVTLDVRLPPLGRIDVTVRERDSGRPIPGASVVARAKDAQASMAPTTTGGDGIAHVGPTFLGKYAVEVEAEGFTAPTFFGADFEVDLSGATALAIVDLVPALSIEGVVRLADGSPAPGARVECDESDGGVEGQEVVGDAQGRFRVGGLREGLHDLSAADAAKSAATDGSQSVRAGRRDVVLTLVPRPAKGDAPDEQPAASIVTVLDPEGRPVPRATLYLRDPERNAYRHWTEVEDGRAELRETEEAGWILEVLRPTSADGAPLPAGVGWGRTDAASGSATVRLPAEAPVAGRVVDAAGGAVAGVLLEAVPESVPVPDARHFADEVVARTRSGPDGAFVLRGTGPEAYRVFLRPPPTCAIPAPIVARGGAGDVVVALRPGVAPTITVLDADGRPLANAIVSASVGPHETHLEWPDSVVTVLNEGGLARTSAEGTVRLAGLDPAARYDLYVGRPQGGPSVLGLDTPDWAPADATIRLPRALRVQGVVEDDAGLPVEGAEVTLTRAGRPSTTARTLSEGTFEFALVPEGKVTLEATVAHVEGEPEAPLEAKATVDAGAEDVRLVVRTGAEITVGIHGLERDAQALLTREPLGPDAPTHPATAHPGGVLRFRGLTPGATYVLWVEPDARGRFIYATALRAGDGDLVANADTGRPLRGTVTAPADCGRIAVRASGAGWSLWTPAGADGRYEFPGLPTGPCRVEAEASRGKEEFAAARDAQTGEVVDLTLEPRR